MPTTDEPTMSPSLGDELLVHLSVQPNGMVAIDELPERFRDPDMLTVCDADDLIKFGTRNHCSPGHELRVENDWEFVSVTGLNRKPMKQIIAEALDSAEDERIRLHVRLTAKGRVQAARLNYGASSGSDGGSRSAQKALGKTEEELVPCWDLDRRRLFLGDQVCKSYQNRAKNQWAILNVFQEDGWPNRVDDPIPGEEGKDREQRLRTTIEDLNTGLDHIVFRLDANGDGVVWEIRTPAPSGSPPAALR